MNKNDFFRSIMVKGKIISMMFFHDDIHIIMVSQSYEINDVRRDAIRGSLFIFSNDSQ